MVGQDGSVIESASFPSLVFFFFFFFFFLSPEDEEDEEDEDYGGGDPPPPPPGVSPDDEEDESEESEESSESSLSSSSASFPDSLVSLTSFAFSRLFFVLSFGASSFGVSPAYVMVTGPVYQSSHSAIVDS